MPVVSTPSIRPRIDKAHGLFLSIKKNQYDRDEFDKIFERRKTEIRDRLSSNGLSKLIESKPDTDYDHQTEFERKVRDRVRSNFEKEHTSAESVEYAIKQYKCVSTDPSKDPLFFLEIQFPNGTRVSHPVHREEKSARIAKVLTKKFNFDDHQCSNLRHFLEYQLSERIKLEKACSAGGIGKEN